MCCCGQIWLLSIMKKQTGGVPNEAYLSAHQAPPFQGSRFPPENGYCQRPQGSRPPPRQGPQGSVRLSIALRDRKPASRVKRETVRGEHRPAPFLFFLPALKYAFRHLSGSFGPALRYLDLAIHKVFLRSETLICAKISR